LDIRGYSAVRGAHTNRRGVLLGAGAALIASAITLRAQPAGRKLRVLVLHSAPIPSGPYHAALKERLAVHGFAEGKNLILDTPVVSIVGREYFRQDIAKLLTPTPDAILAFTPSITSVALSEAPNVPVVFVWVPDPVKSGWAKDYGRPGGNATGVSNRFAEVAVKRLELLRELTPKVRRLAVVGPTYEPEVAEAMANLRVASRRLDFELIDVGTALTLQTMEMQRAIQNGAQALLSMRIYSANGARAAGEEINRLCVAHRIPAIFAESEMVRAGALMSYGTNLVDDVRRAGDMLAKVLRGAKPSDMPIDQASQFELAVNLGTARQMKIRVPPALLARASRVID
jgi:putative ABC transport system substrate-binding protein